VSDGGRDAAPRRALIVVENLSVPFDRRVWQESLALRDAGWDGTLLDAYAVATAARQGG
jgi:hypothetical protein